MSQETADAIRYLADTQNAILERLIAIDERIAKDLERRTDADVARLALDERRLAQEQANYKDGWKRREQEREEDAARRAEERSVDIARQIEWRQEERTYAEAKFPYLRSAK